MQPPSSDLDDVLQHSQLEESTRKSTINPWLVGPLALLSLLSPYYTNIPASSHSKAPRPKPSRLFQEPNHGHPNQPPHDGARANAGSPAVRSQVSMAIPDTNRV